MLRRMFVLGTMAFLSAGTTALAADGFSGVWKVNLAKSKYEPASLAPKSSTGTIEAIDGGLKFTNDSVSAAGVATRTQWSGKFDGKDNPVTGDPARDTAALTKIDDYTIEIINKKAGKVIGTSRTVFARDGKSRTLTSQGTNAQGIRYSNTIVYEK